MAVTHVFKNKALIGCVPGDGAPSFSTEDRAALTAAHCRILQPKGMYTNEIAFAPGVSTSVADFLKAMKG